MFRYCSLKCMNINLFLPVLKTTSSTNVLPETFKTIVYRWVVATEFENFSNLLNCTTPITAWPKPVRRMNYCLLRIVRDSIPYGGTEHKSSGKEIEIYG